ncbi:MAG: response regulator [Nitrosomonas sp.]
MSRHIIILADPDAAQRWAYRQILLSGGFEVIEVESADEVSTCLRSQQPALVVFSMRLWQGSLRCHQWTPPLAATLIPSLLLVPEGFPDDFPKDIADGHLVEPVADTELIAYVRVLLRLSVSVNGGYADIAERKRTEANFAFLTEVSHDLAGLASIEETMNLLAKKIGTHFDASVCAFGEINEAQQYVTIAHEWKQTHLPSWKGVHRISNYHNEDFRQTCQAGEIYIVDDAFNDGRTNAEQMKAFSIGSFVNVPLLREKQWRYQFTLADTLPRHWHDNEIELMRELTTRIWLRLERVRAEQTRERSEEKYRTLFNSIDEGFCTIEVLFDEQGEAVDYRFIETNPAFLRHTGLDNVVGKRVREYLPDHEEFWFKTYGYIAQTGKAKRFEHAAAALEKFYDVYAFRVGLPGKNRVAIIFNDISERKRAETAFKWSASRDELLSHTAARLLESEDPQSLINNLCENVMAFLDCQVFFNFLASKEEKRLHLNAYGGITEAQANTIEWLDFGGSVCGCVARDPHPIVTEDIALCCDARAELVRSCGVQAYCCHPLLVQGEMIGTLSFGTLTRSRFNAEEIAVMRAVANLVAIALHRIETQQALRESEEHFANFMQRLPGLAWIKDVQGHYVYANDAAVQAFRVSRTELYGKADNEIFPADTAAQFRAHDQKVLASMTALAVVETLEHADGIMHHSLVSKFPLYDSEKRVKGTGGVAIDITERVQAEQQLRKVTQKLRDADRSKDEFLATLAHELRNPLAPISNGLHILQLPSVNDETIDKIYAMMQRQVHHLIRLVDDLMEVSRITRGKIELHRQPINLADVIQSAIETSGPLINAARHQIQISLPAEPIILYADQVRLTQVFANLLNNAAKYTHEEGQIQLSAKRDGSSAVISIRDNGMGIPTEMLTKVFDLFTQADRTYHRSQGGLGIGLTLVQHLINMHGGSVDADSNGPGTGSEFEVRLPLIASDSTADKIPLAHQAYVIGPQRILVVDDNRDAADSIATLLSQLNAKVAIVHDGTSALDIIDTFRPSVILLDIGMPGMDGFELARRIRQSPEGRQMTLIALTGWGQEEDRRQSQQADIDHHLIKPVDVLSLKKLLSTSPEVAVADRATPD